jgi:hypothetical protein
MPYWYRRFHYNGPIAVEDWIMDVWIPKHRNLGIDRIWIEGNIRYGDWRRVTNNRFSLKVRVLEGSKAVTVVLKATIERSNKLARALEFLPP